MYGITHSRYCDFCALHEDYVYWNKRGTTLLDLRVFHAESLMLIANKEDRKAYLAWAQKGIDSYIQWNRLITSHSSPSTTRH